MAKKILFFALLLSSFSLNAQVGLDDWTTTTVDTTSTAGTYNYTSTGSGILGGQRDIQLLGNASPSSAHAGIYVADGYLDINGGPGYVMNKLIVTYDGNDDADASTLDATVGLGKIDMTGAGNFETTMQGTDAVMSTPAPYVQYIVYSSPTNFSVATYSMPSGISSPTLISFPVSAFSTGSGASGPADFTQVTAVQIVVSSVFSGFDFTFEGGMTVPSTSTTLAQDWLSFTGSIKNEHITLNWKMATEKNINNYAIERSADGNNFETIGKLKANNKAEGSSYQFVDNLPLKGINYYRIKRVNMDETFEYSTVYQVKNANVSASKYYNCYPNPAKNVITIENKDGDRTDISGTIFNMQGSAVKNFKLSDLQTKVNIENLISGTYVIKLTDGQSLIVQKQ